MSTELTGVSEADLNGLARVSAYVAEFDGWPDYHEVDGTSDANGNYLALTLGDMRSVLSTLRSLNAQASRLLAQLTPDG